MKKKYIKIKPRYIKDEKGNILQVLLTLKEYDSILKTSKSLDALKKSLRKKSNQKSV